MGTNKLLDIINLMRNGEGESAMKAKCAFLILTYYTANLDREHRHDAITLQAVIGEHKSWEEAILGGCFPSLSEMLPNSTTIDQKAEYMAEGWRLIKFLIEY